MGVEAIIALLVGSAATLGAFFGGKRAGKSQDITDAAGAVAVMQAAITQLEKQIASKDILIADLSGRVKTLEGLITQKADVEAVANEVKEIRVIVDRIATKMDV